MNWFFWMRFTLSSMLLATSLIFGATDPRFLGTVYSGGSGERNDSLIFLNDTLYVINFASDPNNLAIMDFSNRLNPNFIGTVDVGSQNSYSSSATPRSLYGSNLFILNKNFSDPYQSNVGLINLQKGRATLRGTMSLDGYDANNIIVHDHTAFLTASSGDQLGYFNASDATPQSQISRLNLGSFSPSRINFQGNLAAVLDAQAVGASNVLLINVADPANFQVLGSIYCGFNNPFSITLKENQAYILTQTSDSAGLLSTVDITNPANPRLLGTLSTAGGDRLYFTGTTGLIPNSASNFVTYMDFTNAQAPVLRGTISSGGQYPQGAAFFNNDRFFVVNYGAGEGTTLNPVGYIQTPLQTRPFLLGTITSGDSGPNGLLQNGPYGYVSYWGNMLGESVGYFALNGGPLSPKGGGTNAQTMASLLNTLVASSLCPESTLNDYYTLANESDEVQGVLLNAYSPQFKVVQYSLEKFDYLLHKEFESNLYDKGPGYSAFVLAGFDHLKQDEVDAFTGYSVDNYYQFAGMSYGWNKLKLLGALGASESYMKLVPFNSKAKYQTVWSTLGLAGKPNRWSYGIDALFGYSFIGTKRFVPIINEKAHSSHGGWTLSFDGKVAHTLPIRDMTLTPYDNFSYLFSRENDYTEHGTNGDNFKVQDEHLSVVRNSVGLDLSIGKRKSFGYFLDLAWLIEYFISSSSYQAALTGTDLYGTFRQKIPTKNYARAKTGFAGYHKNLEWQISYTGLYGHHLLDNSVSVKVSYEF